MCSWIERQHSAGWLLALKDPIAKMKLDHQNNILLFGYVTEIWQVDWAGWCYVNEMHNLEEGYSYLGVPRNRSFADRKYGIWPKDEFTPSGTIVGHGMLHILRPMEELKELLQGAACPTS